MTDSTPASGSWWKTVPGMLTAAAALISAVTGLLVALNQGGLLGDRAGAARAPAAATESRGSAAPTDGGRTTATDAGASTRRASSVAEPVTASGTSAAPRSGAIDLLSKDHGGQLLLAPGDAWSVANDGEEAQYREVKVGEEAVFAFENEGAATFDTFRMLIPSKGRNPREFELLVADQSPAGPYRAVATFHPMDLRVMKSAGWQDFSFPPVTAKYLKVRLRSSYEESVWIDVYEYQLLGTLQ